MKEQVLIVTKIEVPVSVVPKINGSIINFNILSILSTTDTGASNFKSDYTTSMNHVALLNSALELLVIVNNIILPQDKLNCSSTKES